MRRTARSFFPPRGPAGLSQIPCALVRTQPATMSRQATIDDATMRIEVRDRVWTPRDRISAGARAIFRAPSLLFFSRAGVSFPSRRIASARPSAAAPPARPLSRAHSRHLPPPLVPQNPSRVVGSGFIQFPPQRPFAQPIQLQPPTVSVRASRPEPGSAVPPTARATTPSRRARPLARPPRRRVDRAPIAPPRDGRHLRDATRVLGPIDRARRARNPRDIIHPHRQLATRILFL